jgi:3-oxoacyl-[acyl-carrier-protein] synthase-3
MHGMTLRSTAAEPGSMDRLAGWILERATEGPARTVESAGPFTSRIESVGLKLPKRRLSTKELLDSCPHRPRVDLERLTGIRERRVCGEGEDSFTLAVDAAWDCLAHSDHGPEDIEMLVSCSITRYREDLSFHLEPSMSFGIKEAIGAGRALSFDISNACAGMLTGVAIVEDFIRRGVIRRGMVVSGEYISSISDNAAREVRSIVSRQLASLTVGDAGAAVILERAEDGAAGIKAWEFVTHAEHNRLCIGKACRTGPGAAMFTKPRKLHDAAIKAAMPPIARVLAKSGLDIREIDHTIPHQTSKRAIRAGIAHIEDVLGAPPPNVICNVEEVGNTASTSHFVALYRHLEEGTFQRGDRIMLLVYASGLVVGCLVFTMDELVEKYGHHH